MNRTKAEDGNSYKTRFEVKDKLRFKRSFFNKGPHNIPRIKKFKKATIKFQEGKGGNPYVEKHVCAKCRRKHEDKCLVGMGNFYSCV